MRRKEDIRNDIRCGFDTIKARDIDRIGVDGIINKLKERVKDTNVYISVDIDVSCFLVQSFPVIAVRCVA